MHPKTQTFLVVCIAALGGILYGYDLGNAGVSAAFTYLFLPIVGNFGYAAMWAIWGVCTLAYFLFAAFALPETRGKTLEEIENGFVKR